MKKLIFAAAVAGLACLPQTKGIRTVALQRIGQAARR